MKRRLCNASIGAAQRGVVASRSGARAQRHLRSESAAGQDPPCLITQGLRAEALACVARSSQFRTRRFDSATRLCSGGVVRVAESTRMHGVSSTWPGAQTAVGLESAGVLQRVDRRVRTHVFTAYRPQDGGGPSFT